MLNDGGHLASHDQFDSRHSFEDTVREVEQLPLTPIPFEEFAEFVRRSQALEVSPQASDRLFEDLHMDSLGLMVLVTETEELVGLDGDDEPDYPNLESMEDAYKWYVGLMARDSLGR